MKQIFAMLFAAALAVPAVAQTADCATPGTNNAFLGIQTVRLWPGTAPRPKARSVQNWEFVEAHSAPARARPR